MKRLIVLLFMIIGLSANAQFVNPRGGGVRQTQLRSQQNQPRPFEFSPEKSIGLIIYDVEKAAKRVGIKSRSDNYKGFKNTLLKFNKEVKELKRINSFTLNQAKQSVESAHKLAKNSNDISILQNAYKETAEKFKPIANLIDEKERQLDISFEKILSSKQLKKWKRYKQKLKTRRY